jgi:hypothetical protein
VNSHVLAGDEKYAHGCATFVSQMDNARERTARTLMVMISVRRLRRNAANTISGQTK